jgi:hypothetical protein
VDFVKQKKGPAGLVALQKLLPHFDIKKISPIHKYPLTQELAMLKAMAIVVYGSDSPQAWLELGKHDFDVVQNSSLGKIILSLTGFTFANIVQHGHRIMEAFAPFVKYTCEVVDPHNIVITITNDPYPKDYYLGSLTAIKEMTNTPGVLTAEDAGYKTHIYRLKIPE